MSAQRFSLAALAVAAVLVARPAQAQNQTPAVFVEGLGGAAVPTFDIANTAKIGPMFGAAVGYVLDPRWVVMGEFDYGSHKDKATGTVTINTLHYIAKLGYSLTGPKERGWEALVNLGAGAVGFKVAGTTKTYFAINAGAKITYNINRNIGIVISPQGDIAFTKKADLNTTNAWVWPVSAGLRVRF
ncbi:MAG TPA: outer membrane beta-barrel protein [Gemmatimonadales bacterium]|nr:outer membrane beta-barrel protein [Gemmatimonadales bacterium]